MATDSSSSSNLSAGIIVAIVLSVLTILSILIYFLWPVFRRRTRLVRPYRGKVDLTEKFNLGHRKTPSQSSERPLLHEPTSRAQSPDSLRSNDSTWLQGQRPSFSYHGVGSDDHSTESTRLSRLNMQDLSNHPPRRPAPPLETIYSAIDTELRPDRFESASLAQRERWDAKSMDSHIPRRPARPEPLYSTTDRDIVGLNSTLDKFPVPPQFIPSESTIGGILRKVGHRLSRSSRQETERLGFHQHSASLDTGRRQGESSSSSKSPRTIRGRIPPPPSFPPPSVPPSIPLPDLPDLHRTAPSQQTSSNRGIPFDVDADGSMVNTYAARPLRTKRNLSHHKSASVY